MAPQVEHAPVVRVQVRSLMSVAINRSLSFPFEAFKPLAVAHPGDASAQADHHSQEDQSLDGLHVLSPFHGLQSASAGSSAGTPLATAMS
jgi:hypothetical protein